MMNEIQTKLKRVNVTLSGETIALLERVARKGDRSRLINQAVRFYVKETGRAKLRKLLREGAIKRAERDRDIASEWFTLDEQAWQETPK
jgi:CopG family transcriptional regulator/antitoxin EndoAI